MEILRFAEDAHQNSNGNGAFVRKPVVLEKPFDKDGKKDSGSLLAVGAASAEPAPGGPMPPQEPTPEPM